MIILALAGCVAQEKRVEGPFTYRVRVLAEGEPVAGADVHFEQFSITSGHSNVRHVVRGLTDSNGYATARFDDPMWTVAVARAPGHARARASWGCIPEDQDLVLGPETIVRGRLVDELGRPVPHADITIEHERETMTSADGSFTLHNFERGEQVTVRTEYGSRDLVVGDREVTVTVPAIDSVTIGAVTANGYVPAASGWNCLLEERVGERWFPATGPRRESDAREVTFRHLKLGATYRVSARIGGLGCDWSQPFAIDRAAKTPAHCELVPGPSRAVSGTVVGEDGVKIEEALIRFGPDDSAGSAERLRPSGEFRMVDLPLDDTWIHVSAPGFEPRWVPVVEGATDVGTVVLTRSRAE